MNNLICPKSPFVIIALFSVVTIFSSCLGTKHMAYFADQGDATLPSSAYVDDSKIQNNDLLSISVSSLNPTASSLFNAPNLSNVSYSTADGDNGHATGYLVTSDGYIQFPVLGNIKAAGLTKDQLKSEITKELNDRKLLVDPVVVIRYLNYRVTVLGEVAHPTVVSAPNEKITLLEALGLAGDLTIYARRDNIMVIREENGQKIIKRLNLNSPELLNSPYYYLKSNDVVYVEPNNAKVSGASNTRQWMPLVLSALSFVAIIITRVRW